MLLSEKLDLEKMNDSRKRFVDIGLEIVAVAAARVTGRPSRNCLKGFKKPLYLQNDCENHLFPGIKGEIGQPTRADPYQT